MSINVAVAALRLTQTGITVTAGINVACKRVLRGIRGVRKRTWKSVVCGARRQIHAEQKDSRKPVLGVTKVGVNTIRLLWAVHNKRGIRGTRPVYYYKYYNNNNRVRLPLGVPPPPPSPLVNFFVPVLLPRTSRRVLQTMAMANRFDNIIILSLFFVLFSFAGKSRQNYMYRRLTRIRKHSRV